MNCLLQKAIFASWLRANLHNPVFLSEIMNRQLPMINVPFVVSDAIFVDPSYRGTRLQADNQADLDEIRSMLRRKNMRIHNARELHPSPNVERENFQLVDCPLSCDREHDFYDEDYVTSHFYDYCSNLVKSLTNCLEARVLQHEHRDGGGTNRGVGHGYYAASVHADVSPLIEDLTEGTGKQHFGMYNVWRNIDLERNIEMMPLALCDATTVEADDIVYADAWRRTDPPTRFTNSRLVHNSAQTWYYFPQMTPHEVLVFKQYDTRQHNAGRRTTFHVAFKDPTSSNDLPMRQTIEARVLAIYPEEDLESSRRKRKFRAEVPDIRRDGTSIEWQQETMIDWRHY